MNAPAPDPATPFRLRILTALLLIRVRLFLELRGLGRFLERYAYERAAETACALVDPSGAPDDAVALGRLVRETAARLPGTRRCLVQALATALLLGQRGHAHEVIVGVGTRDRGLLAHAWVRCHGVIVVGEGALSGLPAIVAFRPRRACGGEPAPI